VLILISDHGLTEDGRLGGSEPELIELPFVMIGQNVVSGVYSPIQQIDVAPTAAALLGTRLPTVAQGRPLYEMVSLNEEALTRGQLQLATQKVALGDAYSKVMGKNGLSQAIHQDLEGTQKALLDGNQAGALELASLISEEVMAEMASSKAARIQNERVPRLVITALGLCLALLLFWGRRGPHTLISIIAGGVAVAFYYGLYRLAGYSFSLSAVGTIDTFVARLIRYAVVGMLGGGLVLFVDWTPYSRRTGLVSSHHSRLRLWAVRCLSGRTAGPVRLLATGRDHPLVPARPEVNCSAVCGPGPGNRRCSCRDSFALDYRACGVGCRPLAHLLRGARPGMGSYGPTSTPLKIRSIFRCALLSPAPWGNWAQRYNKPWLSSI
jgi:hypothetical protein